jgi:crotonobetainyl-CoA:carnitine CoA-transferase CaiB-like acyl-CoA transferase
MEAAAGLTWLTGYPDRKPDMPNAACDPIAGTHAIIALLLALEHRRRTGEGSTIESPMVFGALNLAAEQVIEHSAYGVLLERDGNRGPVSAPQGFYLTADLDDSGDKDVWIAIAVETDEQWRALVDEVGTPLREIGADDAAARRKAHDDIDEALGAWVGCRSAEEIERRLLAIGVPVSRVPIPTGQLEIEQLHARGWFEELTHPVTGTARYANYPTHFSRGPERLQRRPAPLLGQDNEDVLGELGYSAEQIEAFRREGIIGNAPVT